MKKLIIPALIVGITAMYSCNSGGGSNPSSYAGKWKATAIESPTEDSMTEAQISMYMQQIDKLEKVDEQMAKEFKTSNLDSVKTLLKNQVQSQKEQMAAEKKKAIDNFNLEFLSTGLVLQKNEKGTDTAAWYTAQAQGKTLLFLDPIIVDKDGGAMAFVVDHVGGDSMKLSMHQSKNYKGTVTLKKEK